MNRSPFKTFVKFKRLQNSYEDDCKIFYPTPWDKEYLAYQSYCQDCMNEVAVSSCNADVTYDEEMQQYFEDNPLYDMGSYFCDHEQNDEISPELDEYFPFMSFDNSDVTETLDNRFEDIQPEHCECSDLQQEEYYADIAESDSKMRFNLNRVDYGTANYVEFDVYQNYCERCKRLQRVKKQPSILNLGVFLTNLESKPKILKRRKVKQFHSRKFECVKRRSNTSVTSIVKSDVNIEETITVEDCDCNEIPTEDTKTFKMTYSKAIHCKSSEFRLIEKTTSNDVVNLRMTKINNQTDSKDIKHCQKYSEIVSGNYPRFTSTTPSTSKQSADFKTIEIDLTPDQEATKYIKRGKTYSQVISRNLPKSDLITVGTYKADFKTTQIEEPATKNSKIYKTYSQAVHSNLPKSKFCNPRRTDAPAFVAQNDNLDQISRKNSKTYSQVLYCNLPKSQRTEKTISNQKVNLHTTEINSAFDQTARKDLKTCRTYSQVFLNKLSKSRPSKPQYPNKKVSLRKTNTEEAFDRVAIKETKSNRTSYSQVVYHNLPKSRKRSKTGIDLHTTQTDKSFDQRSTTDVRTCRTYSKVIYCTVSKSRLFKQTSSNKEVGLHTNPTDTTIDQPPTNNITTPKTFSQVVSQSAPEFSSTSNEEVDLNTIQIIKAAAQLPMEDDEMVTIDNDFDQVLAENINETSTEKIKSTETKMNKAELNQISMEDTKICKKLSEAVTNILPETNLIDQKTSQNEFYFNIPIFQLRSEIVNEVLDETMKYKTDSNTESKPQEINEDEFSKDIVEIEINQSIPISPAVEIVSGEKPAISSVHDKTATYELDSETESESQKNNVTKKDTPDLKLNLDIPTCPTWSQIVGGGKMDSISVRNKIAKKTDELKHEQNTLEIKKEPESNMPTCPTWSEIVSGAMLGTSSVHDNSMMGSNTEIKSQVTNEAKPKMKKKRRFAKLDIWSTSLLEKPVEKQAELKQIDQPLFSYADIMKTRKTESCFVKPAPVRNTNLLSSPIDRSYVDSVMDTRPHSNLLNGTPQLTDDSNQLKTTTYFPKNANSAEIKVPSKKTEKWILKEPKQKRSKKSKK